MPVTVQDDIQMQHDAKDQDEHVPNIDKPGFQPLLKSDFDELGLLATAWKFRKVGLFQSITIELC